MLHYFTNARISQNDDMVFLIETNVVRVSQSIRTGSYYRRPVVEIRKWYALPVSEVFVFQDVQKFCLSINNSISCHIFWITQSCFLK